MLIEFSVANFRSLQQSQSLSLVVGKGHEMRGSNTFPLSGNTSLSLLRSAALIGPNAGGKSNFLLALSTMQQIAVDSAINLQRGDKLPVTPFRLDPCTRQLPTEFEVTFAVNGVRYQYGFSATAERIHDEWLFAFPKGRAQRWFQRAWDCSSEQYEWVLGNNLMGEKLLWQKSTRDNAPFLSTAMRLGSEQLQPVFDWFKNTLRVTSVGNWKLHADSSLCKESGKRRVLELLRAVDIEIDDILVEPKAFDVVTLPSAMVIRTVHKDKEGNTVILNFEEESGGTQKLVYLAVICIDALNNGNVLVIDDLHDNLHPRLVQHVVTLFHDSETNPKNAQLVFTTHGTSILNQNLFRRDQIWFCEKDKYQATTLHPLTDFSRPKHRENIELAYISGRYGALPFVRDSHV